MSPQIYHSVVVYIHMVGDVSKDLLRVSEKVKRLHEILCFAAFERDFLITLIVFSETSEDD